MILEQIDKDLLKMAEESIYQMGDWLPLLILACFSPPIGGSHLPSDINLLVFLLLHLLLKLSFIKSLSTNQIASLTGLYQFPKNIYCQF